MSSLQLTELHDRHDAGSGERRGLTRISDLLPELLAKIPAPTESDTDRCPRLPSLASHIMPFPGVLADD